ncbi:UPF0149 family protein [Sphingomonas adhaesiva]|uniref:UPF0149 family protein n=1 Tax=Sphingomonas adhaesiva TaxID=28212 RepID=UPI002FFC5AE1
MRDAAIDEAPDPDPLAALEYLLAERFDDAMLLSELDGYLAALIVGPDTVPQSRWLPRIWGGGPSLLTDEAEAQRFVDLLIHHYEELRRNIAGGAFEPLVDVDERSGETMWELWIEGFAQGMALAPAGWNRLRVTRDPDGAAAMAGISRLVAIADRLIELTREEEDEYDRTATTLIAGWVPMIDRWRLTHDQGPATRAPGRNDPCPCGSGKKHKKCCLAPA